MCGDEDCKFPDVAVDAAGRADAADLFGLGGAKAVEESVFGHAVASHCWVVVLF